MATRTYLVNIDLQQNELQNAKIQNLAGTPSSATSGQIYFDTSVNKLFYYDGTVWVDTTQSEVNIEGVAPITVTQSGSTYSIDIDNATPSTDGAMSSSDKSKLDSSTSNNTPSTLVERDASGFISATGVTIDGTPTNDTDATNKLYVDSLVQGLDVKESVRAIATASITLSGAQTIDGVSLNAGDRVLVAGQGGSLSSPSIDNGIYVVDAGTWSRSADADDTPDDGEVTSGLFTFVTEGTTYADTGWVLSTPDPITVGTTSITFTQFSKADQITAGDGLVKVGNTLNIDLATNSGLTFVTGDLSIDSTIAGDGLSFTSGVLDVNTGVGITISGDNVVLDGSGIAGDGITWNGSSLDVNTGNGISTSGDAVVAVGGTAILVDATGINVVAGTGITLASNDVSIDGPSLAGNNVTWNASTGQFDVSASGDITGVTAGAGLTGGGTQGFVQLDVNAGNGISTSGDQVSAVAGTGISVDTTGINVVAGTAISVDTTGVNVKTDGTTIQTNLSNELQVVPGAFTSKYEQSSVSIGGGPGPQTITHNLGSTYVNVTVFDTSTGEEYAVEVTHNTANSVVIDANGSTRTVNVVVVG